MSVERCRMAVSRSRPLVPLRRRTTLEGPITNLEPPGSGLIHVGANRCHVAARRLAFRTCPRCLHPGAIKLPGPRSSFGWPIWGISGVNKSVNKTSWMNAAGPLGESETCP